MLKQVIRWQFPQVQQISPATLAEWLGSSDRPPPLLLDTRTEAEFAVSHLQSSQRIDSANLTHLEIESDTPIVAYCSVGYRSARLCNQLQALGYSNVLNLEGSLFQWANEGRSVYRAGQPVQQVHPYDQLWGLLLTSELHG